MRNGNTFRWISAAFAISAVVAGSRSARAEGSAQTGYNQRLDISDFSVILKVDANAGEVINISGRRISNGGGNYPWYEVTTATLAAKVTDPTGTVTTYNLSNGAGLLNVNRLESLPTDGQGNYYLPTSGTNAPLQITAATTGTYLVEYVKNGGTGSIDVLPYDISITPDTSTNVRPFVAPSGRGRMHSQHYYFDSGTFDQVAGTDADFYAVSPSGTAGASYIWKLDFEGLSGYTYDILANDIGLENPYSRSSRSWDASPAPKSNALYEIYVNPPATSAVTTSPSVAFDGVGGNGMTVAGQGGTFQFHSNEIGAYQIVIDTNNDGTYDASSTSPDSVINGRVVVGVNQAVWNGKNVSGSTVAAGTYNAKLMLNVGEFHFVAWDDENNYPGLAISSVDPSTLDVSPAKMFWDDRPVTYPETGVRNQSDAPSTLTTLPDGVYSNVMRHEWGNTWNATSYGNQAYIDTWVIGAQSASTVSVAIHSASEDTDGDGVDNATDEYPCDPNKASSVFVPGENTHGMVLFEDLWPQYGDFDFNDAAVSYNYEIIRNASSQITAVRLNVNALAAGAGLHNGLGLALPIATSAVAHVYRRLGTGAADEPSVISNGGNISLHLIDDLKTFLQYPGEFINTEATVPVAPVQAMSVLIEFNTPITLDTSAAPFDLFLFRVGDETHEIHRPMYAGTTNMNTSLFGTGADGSTESRHFVTVGGVPYGLDVPVTAKYPQERQPINLLYPDILAFGTSGGTQHSNFYATNIQTQYEYTGDVFGAVPASPTVPPRIEVYTSTCSEVIE